MGDFAYPNFQLTLDGVSVIFFIIIIRCQTSLRHSMIIFLVVSAALFLTVAGYFVFLVKGRRDGFRFQTRLTGLFLLLTLIPTVPLILLAATLLNQTLEVLPEYLEDTLDSSNAAIREQLIRQNSGMLDLFESEYSLNELLAAARQSSVDYVFRASVHGESVWIDTLFTRSPDAAGNVSLDEDALDMILFGGLGNILYEEERVFESYRVTPDSSILVVGLPVDSITMDAIHKIDNASASYGLLLIAQERLISGNTFYAVGAVLLIFLTLVAITVASRTSRGFIRPIRELVRGFEQVGEGNLDTKITTRAKDEIEYLLKSFNRMVAELKSSQQRLVQSERLAAWRDVARQISHEIKNPLTPIQLSLHRLRKKISVPPEHETAVEESFKTIEEEVDSLRIIATEFSEFARMPKPQLVRACVNDVIKSAARLYEKNDKNIKIELLLDPVLPESDIDPEQMKRVCINLIKNSIEATEKSGKPVIVSSRMKTGADGTPVINLEVRDSGAGMDESVLRKVFDPYFTTKKEGTGLGMSVIKRIVEEHGGEISVESAVGTGTVVSVTLPVALSTGSEQ
ncbi:ATP-binding protein [candidate division KSB1 bacterium]